MAKFFSCGGMVWIKPNDGFIVKTDLFPESLLAIFFAPLGKADMIGRNIADCPKFFSVINIDLVTLANRINDVILVELCLLYTSPSPRDLSTSRMPSSA